MFMFQVDNSTSSITSYMMAMD